MREEATIAWLEDGFCLANKIIGLIPSRRERIATAVLAGLASNQEHWYNHLHSQSAQQAALAADALIAELDKVTP